MKTQGSLKRLLALVMAFAICFSIVPWSVFAAEGDTATLVTDVSQLTAGDQIVIVASGYDYALGTEQKTNNRAQAAVTKSGDAVTLSADVQVLTLEAGAVEGTWAFKTDAGYLYAAGRSKAQGASSNQNYLKTEASLTANSSWSISVADGVASIVAQGDNGCNILRYNNNSSLFSCYVSGQADISIYKLGTSGGETTEPTEETTAPTEETTEPTEETTAPSEPETVTIADGTYVIWSADANKAATALAESDTFGYLQSVSVAMADGALSGYSKKEAFTITNTADGKFTIVDSYGRYMYMTGTYNSFNVSTTLPAAGGEWTVEDAGNGTYYVKNVEMGKYLTYDTTYNSFGAYAEPRETSRITLTHYVEVEAPEVPEEPTGNTATLVTDVAALAAGDQIIIVASGSDAALSTNQKTNNRGQAEVSKSEDGTVVTYGEDTQVITLEAGVAEGTWAFQTGNGYLYAAGQSKAQGASSNQNYLKTETALSGNSSWAIAISADGVASVVAQGDNGCNILRYNSGSSLFSCYVSGQADISIYKLNVTENEESTGLTTGKYVIWAPAYNMALSSVYGGFYNNGVAVTETDGVLSGYTAAEIWDVTVNEDGTITISFGGQNLAMADAYSSMTLGEVNDRWVLEDAGSGLYYAKNTVRGAYIEWYAGKNYWSGYQYINAGTEGMFALKFTPAEEVEEEIDGVANGDYVIWAPAYNTALSSVYGGFYNNGVAVTETGGVLTGYENTEIWTVTNNEDGTITISYGGQKLAMAASYSSLTLGEINDQWVLEDAGNGLWYVKNVNRKCYIEWYASNKYWSGYQYINDGTEGMFALKFTPVLRGYDTDTALVEDIAQWGGGIYDETANASLIQGDRYVSGDQRDDTALFTVVANGVQAKPYQTSTSTTTGGTNYYMGGQNIGKADGDYMQFAVNTAGWGDMTFAFRIRATAAAPGSFQLRYSTDNGATWQNFTTGSYAYAYTGYDSSGESYPVTGSGSVSDGVVKTSMAPTYYISFSFDVPDGAENRENLLIRLVAGSERASGTGAVSGNIRIDSVVLSGSPIVDSSITSYVTVTPDGKEEDQPVGVELTMQSEAGATIYYRVDGGAWQTYDAANKPTLAALPCVIETYAAMEGKADSVTLLYNYAAGTVASVKMSPNGGGVYIAEGTTESITLSCATDGAVIYYATSTDGQVYTEYAQYTEAIVLEKGFEKLYVKAYAVKDGFKDSTVVTRSFTERSSSEYTLYFGQLHSHTNISDGSGSVEEAFAHASQVKNLDFLAVTDHSNSFDGEGNGVLSEDGSAVSDEWAQGHAAAEAITDEDFVGIYGFEMTWSNGLGHMNTFNSPGWQSRTQSAYTTYSTALQNYYDTLTTVPDSISQFNHPGTTFGDFSDFAHYTEAYDELITLIEVGNGEGAIGSSGYFPSYEYYTRALDKGWHVAPTNNQDNHKGLWGDANTGRTVVMADSLTEEGIYDALRNYRVYATEDNDLSIYYSLDGYLMGSILDSSDVGETLTLKVSVSDATDSVIGKVEVIVNGGLSIASESVSGSSQTVTFQVPADYSYYYIKITQADGDIAVTAPVWVGEVEAVGISSFTVDSELNIAGEEQSFTMELYNNENSALEISSIVYTNKATGEVIFTETGISQVGKLDTAVSTFTYTFAKDGIYTITATAKGTLNGIEKTYTKDLEITVMPKNVTSNVIVDGTHYNDYVTGYYGGNMSNMTTLAAQQGISVHVETEEITAEMLAECDLLIISAPARKNGTANAGDYVASSFEDAFIQLVADYVKDGGNVIICGLADYQDKGAVNGADGHAAAQMNKLLAAIGSTMTINDDEAYDEVNNGGQNYRLYPENFNMESQWTKGIVTADSIAEGETYQTYSQYSGCTVNVGEGTWLVKGFDTTYSIDSDGDGKGGIGMGEAVFLAAEESGYGGTIFAAGGVFVSDFEVKAELDNIWDLPYANRTIYENILGITRTPAEVTPIEEVRASAQEELGHIFVVEGYVTAGTANENTTFFDAIYVQDETGGITVFPYSTAGLELGTKIRITGYTDAYQGDIEIQILSCEILEDAKNVVTPEKLNNTDAMNYAKNGGELIQVQGEVVEVIHTSDGKGVAQFVVKDEKGDLAKVFIDGYILSGTTGKNTLGDIVKVGNTVSAVGLLYLHPEGDSEASVAVLRVRDCDEVVLISAGVTDPSEPSESTDPTGSTEATESTESTGSNKPSDGSNAATGDTSGVVVMIVVMVVALVALAVLLILRKKINK